jgi:hypothetical protein
MTPACLLLVSTPDGLDSSEQINGRCLELGDRLVARTLGCPAITRPVKIGGSRSSERDAEQGGRRSDE